MTAVTHSSYVKEHCHEEKSNERLEFLGDAFFDAIIGEEAVSYFPAGGRRFPVAYPSHACLREISCAGSEKAGAGTVSAPGERRRKERWQNQRIYSGGLRMEAIIGAVYLDGGFEAVKDVCAAPVRIFH